MPLLTCGDRLSLSDPFERGILVGGDTVSRGSSSSSCRKWCMSSVWDIREVSAAGWLALSRSLVAAADGAQLTL